LAVLALLGLAAEAGAQESAVQFSFSNPGARSLGFGGAFVALADDATAAFANPAGLVQLTRSEVSVEGRLWDYSTSFTAGGRLAGEPTGIGIDDTAGLRLGTSDTTLTSLSFLSLVYPKGRWSFAFYRHQLANFEVRSATDGLFASFFDGPTLRAEDLRVASELEIVTWAAATGLRVSESFNLGFGLTYNDARSHGRDELFTFPPGGLFLPNPYRPEDQIGLQLGVIDDADWSLTAGLRWRINRRIYLGAVYRPGAAILIEQVLLAGPAILEPEVAPGTVLESNAFDIRLPDVYGIGLAFRAPNEALTVSVEWDRVEYSDILQSVTEGRGGTRGLVQDDGDEVRVGLEYAFLRSEPLVALRFGAWRDPDHRFRFEGQNIVDRAVLRRGDDELHLAAGVGVALDRYQIDLGADFSDEVNTFSLSAIYTF
jgi:long-subunit fatty acid transport protein